MYFVGVDVSKYKHDCFIATETGEIIYRDLTITNNHDGFVTFLQVLTSLGSPDEIRIGFEATAHYTLNLKLFLEKAHHSFMEFNPVLLSKFNNSQTLRRTKTDAIDCASIARWLMTVEYKPYPLGFYHMYSLKSLTRLRDSLVRQRSFYIVKMTNVLDHTFPEFKPFFKERFSATALYILEKYQSPERISRMNSKSHEELHRVSHGKFSMQRFIKLREIAKNTVGEHNEIFGTQLKSILALYRQLVAEIGTLEEEICRLVAEINPQMLTIPGIGPISAAIISSEFGDIFKFQSPAQMLSFAGLEPGYYKSGTSEHNGRMVKRGSL
ncbi:MAG: transposase [Neobacillus sp.]|jgi:transposase|nr:transposase [Neobacillus sp.]